VYRMIKAEYEQLNTNMGHTADMRVVVNGSLMQCYMNVLECFKIL
jgi:hypothetical protein